MCHTKYMIRATMALVVVASPLAGCANDVGYLLDSDTVATTSVTTTSVTTGAPESSTSVEPTTLVPESSSGPTTEEPDSTEPVTTTDMSTSEASSGPETDVDTDPDTESDTDTGEETTGAMCDCMCSDYTCIKDCEFSSCRDIATSLGCSPFGYGFFITRANDTVDVYCDNEWTYRPIVRDFPVSTQDADGICDDFGLNLFYPVSEVHLESAIALAVALDSPDVDEADTYLNLMGIVPDYNTSSLFNGDDACKNTPFNSVDCLTWMSLDGGSWWVKEEPDEDEPDPSSDSAMHSMKYSLDEGELMFRTEVYPTTRKFFCTVYSEDDV